MIDLFLEDSAATEIFGANLLSLLTSPCLIFLHGTLGMGKTTLVRGLLKAAGHTGSVKSPTYNLVEEYDLAGSRIVHFDLYRVADSEELEWMGMRDYLGENSLCFIEWAERGAGYLPLPDLEISLTAAGQGRALILSVVNPRFEGLQRTLTQLYAAG